MKKLIVLVLALAAVLGMIFAVNVSAADAEKLTDLANVSKLYKADGSEIVGGGMNGGSYMKHLFDGGYGACYNNNVGSYIVTDLNAKLPGGYYVTEIKIFHSNNSKFSLYYSKDGGATWNTIVENAQVTEATYAVGDTATQVKYVFTTCANWVASAKEIEIYGIDPSELACTHENLSADAWTPVPGSATCTGVGKVSQTCPDCSEVLEQVSNDVLPLGHDLVTTITRPGTSVSYGAATLKCSRCEYTIDFSGEVNLTDMDRYCSIGESQQFTNVLVSSIADLWGASTVENMFKNDWENIGPFNTWVAAGEDDELEYVMLNFQGVIDLTKIKVLVQNDSGGTLVISALNEETGEYEVVRSLQSYDANIGGGQALVMEVPMLGVTTSSIKIQAFSNWRNTNGYYYNRMVIGELEAYGIAQGCGLDADNHECVYDIFVDYVVAPTCQAAGTATYKCACNATTVVDVEASEEFHNYVEVDGTRVNSTCTVAGYYTGKCSVCEAETTITLEFDLENGHAFTETSRTDADCTTAGSVEYKCDNCEATKTEEIPALGHKFGEAVVVNPTCKDAGSSTKTCEVCFYEDVTTLETTSCTWTLESIITEPTCGAAGEANYVCSVCGETKVDAVAATGAHVWDEENYDVITKPTCEGTGAATFTCTACGATKKDVLSALGHDFSVEVEGSKIDPTCVDAGSVQVSCANGCGKEQTKTIEALGHTMSDATCTAPATCSVCGATEGEANGHAWVAGDYLPAKCNVEGWQDYYCENCDETKREVLAFDTVNGHEIDYSKEYDSEDATCMNAGYLKFTCFYCGEEVTKTFESDPEAHQYDWSQYVYVAATCQTAGYQIQVCALCEKTFREDYDVDPDAHVWDDGVENADGIYYECTLCDATKTEITKGTANDPIIAVDGDNTFVYYATGENYVVYKYSATEAGTITVTTDEGALIYVGENLMGWFYGGAATGGSYTFAVKKAGDYMIVISTDSEKYTLPETFNVSFAGLPALDLGDNNVVYDKYNDYTNVIVNTPGKYVLTFGEDVDVLIVYGPYDATRVENGYRFTVAEGEKVTFAIGNADFISGTYVVNLSVPANIDNSAINGEYYLGADLIIFKDGIMTALGGEFAYTYNVDTGRIDTEAGIFFEMKEGTIYFRGNFSQPLHQHVGDAIISVVTDPTCTADGYTTYLCKYCDTVIETVAGEAATGHNYVESNRVDALPGVAGSVTYTCTNGCGSSYSQTIEALPEHTHTEEIIPAVPSTSKTTGLTSGIKCSECGEIIVAPTTAVTGFKMNANLSLGEDISMYYNVVIPSSLNAKKAYMIVKMIGIDGTEQIITEAKYDASIGRYRFKYTGTKPQFMTDIMNAVVYVPDSNGIISAYEVPEYSVVQYLTGELKKAVAAKDAKLITLISDILYLGQQSQIFIGYKTSEAEWPTTIVAKQGYELTPSTFVKPDPSTSITKVNRDNCDTSIADWKNVGLLIGNSTKLQLVFAAPKLEGLTVKIYVSGVEQDVSYGDLENANLALDEKGRYILVLEGIKVSAYNLPIEAKFFDDDGNQVGSVLTTSVNSFVAANYDKKDAKIQAMLEAVYNYGLSVKAYFG